MSKSPNNDHLDTFFEWLNKTVFSPTEEDKCIVLYSKERDKYFWIVNAHNWENIHREKKWFSITLRNREVASSILNGTTKKSCSTKDKDFMKILKKADPDLENRDPDTREYNSLSSAILDLSATF